jgi:hypothetical protein
MITFDTSFFLAILIFILSRLKRIEITLQYSITELFADIFPVFVIIIVAFLTNVYILNTFSSFEYNFLRILQRVIIYPVLGEILFRYYLIYYAQKVNQNKYFLVLLSAGIFASLHLNRGLSIDSEFFIPTSVSDSLPKSFPTFQRTLSPTQAYDPPPQRIPPQPTQLIN